METDVKIPVRTGVSGKTAWIILKEEEYFKLNGETPETILVWLGIENKMLKEKFEREVRESVDLS